MIRGLISIIGTVIILGAIGLAIYSTYMSASKSNTSNFTIVLLILGIAFVLVTISIANKFSEIKRNKERDNAQKRQQQKVSASHTVSDTVSLGADRSNIRAFIIMLFGGLGILLQFGGGLAVLGLFIFGVYTLFASSIANGLMMIGTAVVGGWVVSIVSGIIIAAGIGAASIGTKDE